MRSVLASAIDRALFRRDAATDEERTRRAERLAETIGRTIQQARAILRGDQALTREHFHVLPALIGQEAARRVAAAEPERGAETRGRRATAAAVRRAWRLVERDAAHKGELRAVKTIRRLADRLCGQQETTT